ncbi:MAG: PIN domain-containing protein, partial [Sulfuritalea sp.]|nr:PIN domain-containing protein [Sulfuritalea sp.]
MDPAATIADPAPSAAPLRVVLDTNVLVSLYVFADSRFAPLRAQVDSGAWQAVTNESCFGEFRR